MSDVVMTQTQVENLFQTLTSTLLGSSLTSALTSGTAYTSLSVSALRVALTTGDSVVISGDGNTQTVTLAADAALGSTTLAVASFTANADYAAGANVYEPNNSVRVQWPTDGAPSWTVDEDVCFIAVTPIDTPYGHPVQKDLSEFDATNANVAMTYTDGIRVQWVLYGPSAFDNAGVLWGGLFSDSTHSTLIANNIPLVPDVSKPIRAPELFNGEWWNRVSLYAQFNELVIRNSQIPYITSANPGLIEG